MQIIEYFSCDERDKYLKQIEKCEWEPAKFMAKLLRENGLQELLGGWCKLFMLTEGDRLISFINFSARDDIAKTGLTPWLGFFYTVPEFRGNHYGKSLLDYACAFAKESGFKSVYISTEHIGLYEKFGFTFQGVESDFHGNPSRVYKKEL
ncbi:MAG: GNAT family N-acetyltransferase [Candidatus Coproplasma sp.]